jgi:hypothetical protein
MIRWRHILWASLGPFVWVATAYSTMPSVFHHGFVNASGKVGNDEELVDYHVFAVFPVLSYGPTLDEAYARMGVPAQMREPLDIASMEYRKIALGAVLSNLEFQGFPYDGMPENMKREYDALLIDSAVVFVTGPTLSSHTPILGVASVSYDWGRGTAGERRLGIRVPRAVPEAGFADFNLRNGRGPLAIREDYSLLLSSRLWFLGGDHNVAEIKTLELSLQSVDWQAQATRLAISPTEVRAQVLSILNHVISSHMLSGKDVLAEPLRKLVPPEELLERRMRELAPRIDRASSGVLERKIALEKAMREYARNPPPQEFSLVNNIFAYTGGLNAKTGRDQIAGREKVFRERFPFPEKLAGFPDPDVPTMTLSVLQGTRAEFDSGKFLRHYSQLPVEHVPTHQHIIHPIAGDLIYGPRGTWGAEPPRQSITFECEKFLSEYSRTFGPVEWRTDG